MIGTVLIAWWLTDELLPGKRKRSNLSPGVGARERQKIGQSYLNRFKFFSQWNLFDVLDQMDQLDQLDLLDQLDQL